MEVIRVNFDGPYRTIIVTPVEVPVAPERDRDPEPREEPAPSHEPADAPEREPARRAVRA